MQFGVSIFPTDYSMDVGRLGRAVEERGFDALLFPEHTHIPVNRRSPWPGGPDLPKHYWHTVDPFVASGVLAASTTRLRFGTGICLVAERDPITTAREVASARLRFRRPLPVRDRRRLERGGDGEPWHRSAQRFKLMRERMLAMKAHMDAGRARISWRICQLRPDLAVAEADPEAPSTDSRGRQRRRVLDRVLEYGDVWMPNHGRGPIEERLATLRQRAAERGRGDIPTWVFGCPPRPDVVERYVRAGVAECLFGLPSAGADELLPLLDQWATLVEQFSTA